MHHPRDSPSTVVMVVDGGQEVVICRVPVRRPDLALVEALARLALDARRGGAALGVRDPSRELRELAELSGLTGALGVEPRRKPEAPEELRPEEVVQPGDPPT